VNEAKVFAFDRMLGVIVAGTKAIDAVVSYGQPKHAPWLYVKAVAE
jgi:hypothetical protein